MILRTMADMIDRCKYLGMIFGEENEVIAVDPLTGDHIPVAVRLSDDENGKPVFIVEGVHA